MKLFKTALIYASDNDYPDIVQIFVEQQRIDINAKDDCLFYLIFISKF